MTYEVNFHQERFLRTGVPSTYVLSMYCYGSSFMAYKIGRTKNLFSRVNALLADFNHGEPRSAAAYPAELVGVCLAAYSRLGECADGLDCVDRWFDIDIWAQFNGDSEAELHKRFAHLRLDTCDLNRAQKRGEWFFSRSEDCDDYANSIDAWLETVPSIGVAA